MSADELSRDREPQPAAARPARRLERLEQILSGCRRNAGSGVGHFDDGDRAFTPAGDADLRRRLALKRLDRKSVV